MSFTTVGYHESVDPDGAFVEIAAIPDQHVVSQGDDITVPVGMDNLIGEAALSAQINPIGSQVSSPALRAIALLDVEPFIAAVLFGSPPESVMHPMNPLPLKATESLNFLMNTNPAAAGIHIGLVWLADGQQQPVTGNIYTVRTTASAALAAGVWVNSALVFTQELPVGRYQIVGMRARGANLVCVRLVFIGGLWRPGVPAVNAIGDDDPSVFRHGRLGVWGEFDHTNPPLVDCFGLTDTAQTIFLDLIKVA